MKHQRPIFLLVFMVSFSGLSEIKESDFNDINQAILNIYRPILAENGEKVELKELFQGFGGAFKVDSTLKYWGENLIIITLTGAVPKNPAINVEGYAIVACHEMGHILGGEPRQKSKLSKWSSVEGQADYFATSLCMWQLMKAMPKDGVSIEPLCAAQFNGAKKVADCSRILSGIKALVSYFNASQTTAKSISIDQKDLSKVSYTLQKYPSPQCRVDTWMAGLLGKERPSCWFAP